MSLTLTLPTSHISASSNSLLRSSGGVSSLIHTARVHSRLSQFGVSHESAGATELQHLKWVSNDPVYAPHGVTDAKLDINLDWAGVTSKEPQPMRADLALLRNKDVKWSSRAAGVEKQQQIKEWTQGNVCALSGKQHSFHHNRLRKKKKTGQEHLAPKSSVNLLWKYHVLQSDLSIVQLKMTGSVNKALEDLLKLPTWFYMNLWGACSSWNTEPRDCVVTDCWKWSRWSILSNRSSCAFTRNRTESQCRGEETCKKETDLALKRACGRVSGGLIETAEYLTDVVSQRAFLTERPYEHRWRLADAEEQQRAHIRNLETKKVLVMVPFQHCGTLN